MMQRAQKANLQMADRGICCGAWLGGKRAVLMIQSSGVGNCINTFSLETNCGLGSCKKSANDGGF
jgi:sulfopyruvate decarboxylase TPP-binding subunit